MNRKSYKGQRFGKLFVEEMIYTNNNGRYKTSCRCICDCGNEIVTSIDSLKRSKTSCGCDVRQRRIDKNRKDITGRRFNRLVVKEMLWDHKPTKCRCVCDCGNIVDVIGTGLTSGKTGSCGCYQRDMASSSNTKDWTGVVSPSGISFVRQYRKNNKGQWSWVCMCSLCGGEFIALPAKIMNSHITSCGCRKTSSGEEKIRCILNNLCLKYKEQYRFPDCKYKYTLPFDFAIFCNESLLCLIEYDGKQHYSPVELFGGEHGYLETKTRDEIKNNFCKNNDINLIRLPYTLSDKEIEQRIINTIYP